MPQVAAQASDFDVFGVRPGSLDKLQYRVLYCDTVSVIFTSRPGEWVPPLGPYLGDLTDELNDGSPGEDYITEFVSGGPSG